MAPTAARDLPRPRLASEDLTHPIGGAPCGAPLFLPAPGQSVRSMEPVQRQSDGRSLLGVGLVVASACSYGTLAIGAPADVIVVGKSRRPRLRLTPSVARRLLCTTRHIVVVV